MSNTNAIYCRISSNKQTLEQQKEACINFAKDNNLYTENIRIYVDNGVSAYKTDKEEREELDKLLSDIERGKVSNLIVFSLDRLSRRGVSEGTTIIDLCTKCNCKVFSVVDNMCINENDIQEIVNTLKFYFAKNESKLIGERVKAKKQLMKENGEFIGFSIPLGFKVEDKKLIVDNDKKAIIITLFNTYINLGSKKAMEYLKANGVLCNSNQALKQYLISERYIEIVGEEVFYKANKLLKEKNTRSNPNGINKETFESFIIGNNLVYHKECECKLLVSKYYGKNGGYLYYCNHCKTYKLNNKKTWSNNKYLINEQLEELLLIHLEELRNNKEAILNTLENSNNNNEKRGCKKDIEEAIKTLEETNDSLASQINTIALNGGNINVLIQLIDKNNKEVDKLKEQLTEIHKEYVLYYAEHKEVINILENIEELIKTYEDITIPNKRSMLKILSDRITISNNSKLEIQWKI